MNANILVEALLPGLLTLLNPKLGEKVSRRHCERCHPCFCSLVLSHASQLWEKHTTYKQLVKGVYGIWTSSQDGGVGRHTVPPCTTKRKTTTNLKTKNNQNCQKIELYGNPTTKDLKEKHSSRLVGGAETGGQAERTQGKVAAGGPGQARLQLASKAVVGRPGEAVGCRPGRPTFACRKTGRNNWGDRQTWQPRIPVGK